LKNAALHKLVQWLYRRAENIAAALLAAIFITFLLQIMFRYVLGWPVGWTLEVSTLLWMWLVLWGASFVVSEQDEIRFDLIYTSVSERIRRGFTVVTAVVLVWLFVVAMPDVVDYVTFMKVEDASYIGVRLDYLFSIYIIFAVAIIGRYVFLTWQAIRGRTPEHLDIYHSGEE
jgi:C4-dicarboxylate transporter, DctQ subunit